MRGTLIYCIVLCLIFAALPASVLAEDLLLSDVPKDAIVLDSGYIETEAGTDSKVETTPPDIDGTAENLGSGSSETFDLDASSEQPDEDLPPDNGTDSGTPSSNAEDGMIALPVPMTAIAPQSTADKISVKIGDNETFYDDFAAAITAANNATSDNIEVVINKPIEITEPTTITKKMTIDGGKHLVTISSAGGVLFDIKTEGVTLTRLNLSVTSSLSNIVASDAGYNFIYNNISVADGGQVETVLKGNGTIRKNIVKGTKAMLTISSDEAASIYDIRENFFDADNDGKGELPRVTRNGEPYYGAIVTAFPYYTDESLTQLATDSSLAADLKDAIAKASISPTVESVSPVRDMLLAYPNAAKLIDNETIFKLDNIYRIANGFSVSTMSTVNSSALIIDPSKVVLKGAALYAENGEAVVLNIADYKGTRLPQPSRYDCLRPELELTLTIGGKTVTAFSTPISIAMPVPKGADRSRLTVLHHLNSTIDFITPYECKENASDGNRLYASFVTNKLSPFVFANRKPSFSGSSTNTTDRDAYDYWCGILDDIKDAADEATIYASARDYKTIPASVLEALEGKDVTLEIDYRGRTITVYGKKMHPIEENRVYYTLNDLDELYQKPIAEPAKPAAPSVIPPTIVDTITPLPQSPSQSEAASSAEGSDSKPESQTETVTRSATVPPPKPESSFRLWILLTVVSSAIAVITVIVCICTVHTERRRF